MNSTSNNSIENNKSRCSVARKRRQSWIASWGRVVTDIANRCDRSCKSREDVAPKTLKCISQLMRRTQINGKIYCFRQSKRKFGANRMKFIGNNNTFEGRIIKPNVQTANKCRRHWSTSSTTELHNLIQFAGYCFGMSIGDRVRWPIKIALNINCKLLGGSITLWRAHWRRWRCRFLPPI